MKNIKFIIFSTILFITFGCGDEFLTRKDLYEKTDENYYRNAKDIGEALAGAYSTLSPDVLYTDPIFMANLLSDDCFGGGGSGDLSFHDIDGFTNQVEDNYYGLWKSYYKGILRVNMIIKRIDQAQFDVASDKLQAQGEAYFLRAYFYFTLARFFGPVPLITDPTPANNPRPTPDVLYAQIASDMKKAIELMPAISYDKWPASMIGHVNKWVAEGMMARIFLFYTGYYNQTSIPLTEGGSISKQNVIDWLDDCIKNSGYDLASDFRNIWPYSYSGLRPQYPYSKANNLNWIGEGKDNKETMFAIKYSVFGGWNLPTKVTYANMLCLYMGLRIQTDLIPWSNGWGGGPVNPQLMQSFENGDIRMKGSIIDVTDTMEGNVAQKYVWGSNQCMHETGLWNKKYTSLQMKLSDGTIGGIFMDMIPSTPANNQLWNLQDEIILRFADVLLMAAELGGPNAQAYLDRVRDRVGLPHVPANLDNIKNERRHELAFEGVRYFDLLRWHDESALNVSNIPVKNSGVDDVYSLTFRSETHGFLPIPETEIRLSNGVLTQNEGW
jgi:hypothetical protein